MSRKNSGTKLRVFFKFIMSVMPFLGVIYGAYFIYTGYYLRGRLNKTCDDIRVFDRNLKGLGKYVYINFDNNYVVKAELLPFDMEVYRNKEDTLYSIKNRFGGNIFFKEGLNSEAERMLYYGLINDHEKYKKIYTGVSSYILFFTGLDSFECKKLSTYNWAEMLPNYIAIEVSSLNVGRLNDGLNRLQTTFIPDAQYDDIYNRFIKDKGITSKEPLSDDKAKSACSCNSRNCTFAIKLR